MNLSRLSLNVVVLNVLNCPVYLQAVASSALGKLVRGLPDTLQKQYDYEEPLVRGGKHLFHSDFFKVSTAVLFYHLSNTQALLFNLGCDCEFFL